MKRPTSPSLAGVMPSTVCTLRFFSSVLSDDVQAPDDDDPTPSVNCRAALWLRNWTAKRPTSLGGHGQPRL